MQNLAKKFDKESVEWQVGQGLTPYLEAVATMEARVASIRAGSAGELVWLVEHPPLYTAGTSAKPSDLLDGARFPVYQTGRGGEYTYHGPGQRVAYVMLDLKARSMSGTPDLRAYVKTLEQWIIRTLAHFGLEGKTIPGRIGVWVKDASGVEVKIAALGIRVRQGVSYHGIAINVNPDLSHYAGIVPCGIKDAGMTSLAALGIKATMAELDAALRAEF